MNTPARTIRFCLGCLLLGLPAAGLLAGAPPSVAPVQVTAGPVLDGKLDDPAWRDAPEVGPFCDMYDRAKPLAERTTFKVLYDAGQLYIGVICRDANMPTLKADSKIRDDGSLFDDDSLEIFVDPGRTGVVYYQFVCNALGNTWDARNTVRPGKDYVIDAAWNGAWTAAADRATDRWTVELAIPFAALGVPLKPGSIWGLGVNRNIKTRDAAGRRRDLYTMWAPTQSKQGYQAVSDFGNLWFGGDREVVGKLWNELNAVCRESDRFEWKIREVLRGRVPDKEGFEQRVQELFGPVAAARRESSPYLAAGDARVALDNVRRDWKDLYYDIKFAVLLGN